jgi:hypothetical protein
LSSMVFSMRSIIRNLLVAHVHSPRRRNAQPIYCASGRVGEFAPLRTQLARHMPFSVEVQRCINEAFARLTSSTANSRGGTQA